MMWQYQIISNSFSFYQYQIIYYFLIKGIIILILKHNQYKPIAPKWQYQQSIYINSISLNTNSFPFSENSRDKHHDEEYKEKTVNMKFFANRTQCFLWISINRNCITSSTTRNIAFAWTYLRYKQFSRSQLYSYPR